MTVSWFGGSHDSLPRGKLSIKEAVQALYPPRHYLSPWDHTSVEDRKSRFSSLLLEHGEQHIQDWAVIAYTTPMSSAGQSAKSGESGAPLRGGKALKTQWAQQPARSPAKLKVQTSSKLLRNMQNVPKKTDRDDVPSAHMTKIEGRLHLCSLSIVFEPNETSRGILRCPFRKMDAPPKEFPIAFQQDSTGSYEPMCVEFTSAKHTVMKANNAIGPFEQVSLPTIFRFTFLHSRPGALVELCGKLFSILHKSDKHKARGADSPELQQLLRPMLDRPFDTSNLVDVRERPVTSNLKCRLVQPLQTKPGCLLLTNERLYFQPAEGVLTGEGTRPQTWLRSHLVATARRYHGLQDCACELYWKDGTSTLFALQSKHERETLLRFLPSNVPCHTDRDFLIRASKEWQSKNISNYEYLLVLNSAASRTLHDLSRYPVFPWVLADYESPKLDLKSPKSYRDLSKPVGALNAERLAYFQQRFQSMQDMEDPFLYGTHYSAAGYVLYYLVRSMPEHMLCLQNGKFDAPDRLFYNIPNCYNCVLTNHADVKELIPEFFNPHLEFDFLINTKSLQLGATQTGDRVDDVVLPPWAKSARDFLKKNRKALESDICTSMLPRWIDLIFGAKSRGEAAKEANNLFHKSSYMGPSDWSALPSDEDRLQAELQAMEFGIVPDQLFVGPHPLRHETVDESFVHSDLGRSLTADGDGKGDAWELLDAPLQSFEANGRDPPVVESIPDPLENPSHSKDMSLPSAEESLKARKSNDETALAEPTMPAKSLALSGSGDLDRQRGSATSGAFSSIGIQQSLSNVSASSAIPALNMTKAESSVSDWDMKVLERTRIHEDAVSGCSVLVDPGNPKRSILVTCSLDGKLKVHHASIMPTQGLEQDKAGISSTLSRFSYLSMSRGSMAPSQSKLSEFRSHTSRDPLACLAVSGDGQGGQIAFSGGHDDVVLAYGINSACAVASVYSHRDAVTGLALIKRSPTNTAAALWRENSTHIMVSGSWDATVKVWSVSVSAGETVAINREPLAELFDADSSIVCVSASPVVGGGIVVAAGSVDGSVCVWNVHPDGVKVVIHNEPASRGSGPCSVVQWCAIGGELHLFSGFSTGKVACHRLKNGSMSKTSAVSVGVAVQCLRYSEGILLAGCTDGGLRLIPIRDDGTFSPNPTLWTAVNNQASPGISSIDVAYMGNVNDGEARCICCTGGVDGSIAIFELKRVKM